MTIKDIAKACGVGGSTVSRVLNNRPDVSPEVRARVLEVVENTGYIPNNSARDLGRSQSDAIGVVVRGTGNLFFSEVLKTIALEIDRGGYTMVPRFIGSDDDEELSLIGIPYLCCSFTNCFGSLSEENFSSVSIDDYRTAYLAVEKLIELGHRRIAALIPSCSDHSISELRYNGYRDALRDHGIAFDPELVMENGGCFDMPETYRGMRALLERGADFTAAFVLSDTTAIAAIKALEDAGKRVPEEVSVIAIDGLEISDYTTPTLSTMAQPAEQMGRESVLLLLDVLNGGENRHVRLETAFRNGASIRAL